MIARTVTRTESFAEPSAVWETELFLLRADERVSLIEKIRQTAQLLDEERPMRELAHSMLLEAAPGGSRLAVVASSYDDLSKKLHRAAERLADPKVKQIRDVQGVYWFESPLYSLGSVAVLAPGEGAQYLDMLEELCRHFPEVAAGFDWCDRLAAEAGRREDSLRSLIHPRDDASSSDREEAEAKLRQLGPSICAVLVADVAVNELLKSLKLPVSAYAGHSAGELAALLHAGAIPQDALMGSQLLGVVDLMQRQEEEAGGQETLLLATGAGKETIAQIVAAQQAANVFVAMDNCPHQSVVVGAAEGVKAVEATLQERGILCERLPFHRPYHTPLFAPWLGPFYDLFHSMPVFPPRTPVYSATTGGRFPDDADAIRNLTVDHWKSPVEFARMIETMYADGVRIFVEAGPRGNLSSFVEDILRGRPFAALPIDTPRRAGLTQLNHVAAQLLAHHVPIEARRLFAGRVNARSEEPSTEDSAALLRYFDVMDQFLNVQREVMAAWLQGGDTEENPSAPPQSSLLTRYSLTGDIVRFDPGRELVMRRLLDLAEDRIVDDHTIGGRSTSRVDPNQHGLPVLPMTFSLEIMAECASLLLPDWTVTAVRDIRLMRWLPYESQPVEIEVSATVQATNPPTVKVQIRDLSADKTTAQGVVELQAGFPQAPLSATAALTNERPCRATIHDLYRNLFHGPLFQGMRTLDRFGDDGIEGTVEVLPRERWFASTPAPRLVLDPVLIDMCMHILGAWHLEQPDWTGRILLPIGLKSIEFFGPPPAPGTMLTVRGTNEEASARHFVHGVEAALPGGRLWCRLRGAGYWRFYLPFGRFNFFGPKDEYFLCKPIPEALPPGEIASRCWFLEIPADLSTQPVLRSAGASVTMTPRELAEFERAYRNLADAEVNALLFGRMAGKDAVRSLRNDRYGDRMFPADIDLEWDGASRPIARPRDPAHPGEMPQVCIAHCDGRVAALAAFHPHVGIAIEKIGDDEAAARQRAARTAVRGCGTERPNSPASRSLRGKEGDSPPLPGERPTHEGVVDLPIDGFLVRTVRLGDYIVATTFGEAAREQ